MAQLPRRFVAETLMPEFEELNGTLRSYLDEVTSRVVAEVLHADVSEAAETDEPGRLAPEAESLESDGPRTGTDRRRARNERKRRRKGRR